MSTQVNVIFDSGTHAGVDPNRLFANPNSEGMELNTVADSSAAVSEGPFMLESEQYITESSEVAMVLCKKPAKA